MAKTVGHSMEHIKTPVSCFGEDRVIDNNGILVCKIAYHGSGREVTRAINNHDRLLEACKESLVLLETLRAEKVMVKIITSIKFSSLKQELEEAIQVVEEG